MEIKKSNIIQPSHPVIYPDTDGKPMADNTLQALWIVLLYNNLRALFRGKNVFIAADLLWYPIEGDPKTRVAPDVMVVFDRPDGHRGSYKQWEEDNIPITVVFEIISPSNTGIEMLNKLDFYEQHAVSEFIILDPLKNEFVAFQANEGKLERANTASESWTSPRLGIQFEIVEGKLKALHTDGSPLKSFEEIQEEKVAAEAAKLEAESAEKAALKEIERLKARLRGLGENPD